MQRRDVLGLAGAAALAPFAKPALAQAWQQPVSCISIVSSLGLDFGHSLGHRHGLGEGLAIGPVMPMPSPARLKGWQGGPQTWAGGHAVAS